MIFKIQQSRITDRFILTNGFVKTFEFSTKEMLVQGFVNFHILDLEVFVEYHDDRNWTTIKTFEYKSLELLIHNEYPDLLL